MIIWRGKGILVLISAFIGMSLATSILMFVKVDIREPLGAAITGLLITLSTAGSNYLLTKKFVVDRPYIIQDPATGVRKTVKNDSHLFFIPNRYWTWIILAIGLIATVVSVFTVLRK